MAKWLASRIYCSYFLMLGLKVDGESNYYQVVIGLLYMASPMVAGIIYVPADAKALPREGASASVWWKQEKGDPIDEHICTAESTSCRWKRYIVAAK